ncbi:MAG: HlyC/CorC family transporter [Spirochaetaceae bacterium]|nr:HlyC/CorC family transporter [Spirochaetaceae bacterium]
MGIFDFFKQKKEFEKLLQEGSNDELKEMLEGVITLSQTTVREILIPRTDVDFLTVNDSQEELLTKIMESGHSRFPVYEDSIDNVVGILYVKDIIKQFAKNEPLNVRNILRRPFFIPETKRIDSLLRDFKRKHVHIAVVVDEYGGVAGIVCMEDVIEEIVGDIRDEFDNETDDITKIAEGIWLCDARIDLDNLQEMLEVEFPTEEFDSLGGFVFDLFGKIPVNFEKITWNNFDFIIQEMDGHRIQLVKIVKHTKE